MNIESSKNVSHGKQENIPESSPADIMPKDTSWLEVYGFPTDCVATELSYHFSCPPYLAECKTSINRMWNPRSSTFVLEFSTSDVDKIMERPVQLLDEEDPSSEIKISRLEVRRCTQVLVTCEHEMSSRMIKSYFKKFGEIENCCHQQYAILFGDYRAILTFKTQSVAEEVASVLHHQIGPGVTVNSQLLKDDMLRSIDPDEPNSPGMETSFSLNFDMESVSSILPPYKPSRIQESSTAEELDIAHMNTEPQSNVYEEVNIGSNLLTLNAQPMPPESGSSTSSATMHSQSGDETTYDTVNIKSTVAIQAPVPPLVPPKQVPVLPALPAKQVPVPPVSLHCCVQVNNCIVRLVRGDLSQHAADVLVHSSGSTSQVLYRKCNTSISSVQVIQTLEASPSEYFTLTTAPNLAARYLIGFKLNPNEVKESLRRCVVATLQHCDKLKVKSVAFPALGTGCLEETPKTMAPALVRSITECMISQSQSTLEIIDIVIYNESTVDAYSKAMLDVPKEKTTPKAKIQSVNKISSILNKLFIGDH